ncbi:MAG: AAA family ATPase [Nitrospira sp.]|nr:AAA family ATPase [Nitrospira sp.]
MPESSTTSLHRLLSNECTPDEERTLVTSIMEENPNLTPQLTQFYLQHKLRLQQSLTEATKVYGQLRDAIGRTTWVQSIFLDLGPGLPPRALVAQGSRRGLVSIDPDIDPATLQRGQLVYVNDQHNCLVCTGERFPPAGTVGTVVAVIGSRVLVRSTQDDQSVMDLLDLSLADRLQPGDHVTYLPESRLVLERIELPPVTLPGIQLEAAPAVTFDQLGGLDAIVETLTEEIRLHVFHRDVVTQHHLPMRKGLLLYGPPGCGKTLLAKALARYVADLEGVDGRFLSVKAGSHRSMWYGQSEANLRTLFTMARHAAAAGQFVTMFFDDFDHFGSRDGVGHDVDARILPTLLHEVDSLQSVPNIFLIGATNRPDLMDDALLRPGRFGDRAVSVPRPNRSAAQAIFRVHLPVDLAYAIDDEAAPELRETVMTHLLSQVYAPNGELAHLGQLTFRDGSRKPLEASQLMSGALIANAVTEVKHRSCMRVLDGRPAAITLQDLADALHQELMGLASRLKPGAGLKQQLDLPSDLDVVRIELNTTERNMQQTAWRQADHLSLTR